LLWIPPLGLFGIHRFYNGRIVSGIIWALTAGLAGIGWLVDLFLIPGMVRTCNLEERVYRHDVRLTGGMPGQVPVPAPPGVADGFRSIYCTRCGSAMQVPQEAVGRQYQCPSCRTVVVVPS